MPDHFKEIVDNGDGTFDLIGVEVLSTGGPIYAVGSPPGGDFYTRTDLEAMAAANIALAEEIKAPNKIGHSDAQTLVKNSQLAVPTPGEMPAVGWLDGTTFRVEDAPAIDGAKLLSDVRRVPRTLVEAIEKGAYRTRSAELSRVTSQVTGVVHDWVVTGLAWLGAKLPAIQTLEDVVKLYERAEIDAPLTELRAFAVVGQTVWAPDAGFQSLRDDIAEALNGPPTGGMNDPRFWVYDVALTLDRALVQDYFDEGDAGYVIPFTRAADGSISISPSSDWTPVEQGWVAAAKEYERVFRRRAESRSMDDATLTEEQVATLAEKLGVEGDATPEALLAAAETRANELAAAKAKADEIETRKNEGDERLRQLEADAAEGKKAARKLFEMERDQAVDGAVTDGRLDPADREKWQKRYEDNPELTKEILSELKPDTDLVRELGREDGDPDEVADEQYERDFEARFGHKPVGV